MIAKMISNEPKELTVEQYKNLINIYESEINSFSFIHADELTQNEGVLLFLIFITDIINLYFATEKDFIESYIQVLFSLYKEKIDKKEDVQEFARSKLFENIIQLLLTYLNEREVGFSHNTILLYLSELLTLSNEQVFLDFYNSIF